jgi:5-methylcytosine-specific restriction endonuclease McrA
VAKRKRGQEAPCAYCGAVEELTLDHVIPRCLFGDKKDQKAPPMPQLCTLAGSVTATRSRSTTAT